jgi:hypothetical protein
MPAPAIPGYLTEAQFAEQVGVTVRTLRRWHAEKRGPARKVLGRRPLYPADAAVKYLDGMGNGAQERVLSSPRWRRRGRTP